MNGKHFKPFNKTKTFQLKKSPSMEFSASFGEEMLHFSHPQHSLSKLDVPDLFTCSGCKEFGAGKRFSCQQCNFHLHEFCASAPSTLKAHPFHCHHQLLFYSKPGKQSKCDICSKPAKGYNFRCKSCSFQMHPCCAMLSSPMKLPDYHPHTLRIVPPGNAAAQSGRDNSYMCGECRRRRSGRVYHCTVCDYHLHAVCAKNMKNGLNENGIKDRTEKPSVLGTAAKFAGHVVIEFIGGFIEGLGEVVGEVLVQNATKGDNNRTRATRN